MLCHVTHQVSKTVQQTVKRQRVLQTVQIGAVLCHGRAYTHTLPYLATSSSVSMAWSGRIKIRLPSHRWDLCGERVRVMWGEREKKSDMRWERGRVMKRGSGSEGAIDEERSSTKWETARRLKSMNNKKEEGEMLHRQCEGRKESNNNRFIGEEKEAWS